MVLGLVTLVLAVFIAVPVVIVLVAPIVVTPVVLVLPIFLLPIFLVPVVLRAGSSHRRNRCSKGGSQKNRTEISVSTVHCRSPQCEIHIRRIPLPSLSALGALESGQYCSGMLGRIPQIRETARNKLLLGSTAWPSGETLELLPHRGYS